MDESGQPGATHTEHSLMYTVYPSSGAGSQSQREQERDVACHVRSALSTASGRDQGDKGIEGADIAPTLESFAAEVEDGSLGLDSRFRVLDAFQIGHVSRADDAAYELSAHEASGLRERSAGEVPVPSRSSDLLQVRLVRAPQCRGGLCDRGEGRGIPGGGVVVEGEGIRGEGQADVESGGAKARELGIEASEAAAGVLLVRGLRIRPGGSGRDHYAPGVQVTVDEALLLAQEGGVELSRRRCHALGVRAKSGHHIRQAAGAAVGRVLGIVRLTEYVLGCDAAEEVVRETCRVRV
mmetsp:Transcript_28691/g.84090  ORF Transcript_28691/g.84090 Transcript_28691/m.84090 type:complete len:295 (-) Transcript_28691:504-1388(-)